MYSTAAVRLLSLLDSCHVDRLSLPLVQVMLPFVSRVLCRNRICRHTQRWNRSFWARLSCSHRKCSPNQGPFLRRQIGTNTMDFYSSRNLWQPYRAKPVWHSILPKIHRIETSSGLQLTTSPRIGWAWIFCSIYMDLNSNSGCTIFFEGRQRYPRRSVVSKCAGRCPIWYLLSVCVTFSAAPQSSCAEVWQRARRNERGQLEPDAPDDVVRDS